MYTFYDRKQSLILGTIDILLLLLPKKRTNLLIYARVQPSMPIELVSEHMEGMIMRVSCAHYHVFCKFLLTGSPRHIASMNILSECARQSQPILCILS